MNVRKSIEQFLPKYLSPEKQQKLVRLIDGFPGNINSRFYTNSLKNERTIFQGDGIDFLQVSNFPSTGVKNALCIITSNTCDIDSANPRFTQSRITYCPLVEIKKYQNILLKSGIDKKKVDGHLKALRNQELTMMLYLPQKGDFQESVAFLDRINNCSAKILTKENIESKRVFTLSNYGFYLFLLKLSISFTRISEGVDRN